MLISPEWMLKRFSGNGIDRHGICTCSTFAGNAKCFPNYLQFTSLFSVTDKSFPRDHLNNCYYPILLILGYFVCVELCLIVV